MIPIIARNDSIAFSKTFSEFYGTCETEEKLLDSFIEILITYAISSATKPVVYWAAWGDITISVAIVAK